MRDNAKGGALTEVTFFILLSLYTPKHGYAVMQFIEEKTDGRLSLGAGTPQQDHFGNADALQKRSPGWTANFQELKICGHGTVLALYRYAQNAFSTNVSELLRHKK